MATPISAESSQSVRRRDGQDGDVDAMQHESQNPQFSDEGSTRQVEDQSHQANRQSNSMCHVPASAIALSGMWQTQREEILRNLFPAADGGNSGTDSAKFYAGGGGGSAICDLQAEEKNVENADRGFSSIIGWQGKTWFVDPSLDTEAEQDHQTRLLLHQSHLRNLLQDQGVRQVENDLLTQQRDLEMRHHLKHLKEPDVQERFQQQLQRQPHLSCGQEQQGYHSDNGPQQQILLNRILIQQRLHQLQEWQQIQSRQHNLQKGFHDYNAVKDDLPIRTKRKVPDLPSTGNLTFLHKSLNRQASTVSSTSSLASSSASYLSLNVREGTTSAPPLNHGGDDGDGHDFEIISPHGAPPMKRSNSAVSTVEGSPRLSSPQVAVSFPSIEESLHDSTFDGGSRDAFNHPVSPALLSVSSPPISIAEKRENIWVSSNEIVPPPPTPQSLTKHCDWTSEEDLIVARWLTANGFEGLQSLMSDASISSPSCTTGGRSAALIARASAMPVVEGVKFDARGLQWIARSFDSISSVIPQTKRFPLRRWGFMKAHKYACDNVAAAYKPGTFADWEFPDVNDVNNDKADVGDLVNDSGAGGCGTAGDSIPVSASSSVPSASGLSGASPVGGARETQSAMAAAGSMSNGSEGGEFCNNAYHDCSGVNEASSTVKSTAPNASKVSGSSNRSVNAPPVTGGSAGSGHGFVASSSMSLTEYYMLPDAPGVLLPVVKGVSRDKKSKRWAVYYKGHRHYFYDKNYGGSRYAYETAVKVRRQQAQEVEMSQTTVSPLEAVDPRLRPHQRALSILLKDLCRCVATNPLLPSGLRGPLASFLCTQWECVRAASHSLELHLHLVVFSRCLHANILPSSLPYTTQIQLIVSHLTLQLHSVGDVLQKTGVKHLILQISQYMSPANSSSPSQASLASSPPSLPALPSRSPSSVLSSIPSSSQSPSTSWPSALPSPSSFSSFSSFPHSSVTPFHLAPPSSSSSLPPLASEALHSYMPVRFPSVSSLAPVIHKLHTNSTTDTSRAAVDIGRGILIDKESLTLSPLSAPVSNRSLTASSSEAPSSTPTETRSTESTSTESTSTEFTSTDTASKDFISADASSAVSPSKALPEMSPSHFNLMSSTSALFSSLSSPSNSTSATSLSRFVESDTKRQKLEGNTPATLDKSP